MLSEFKDLLKSACVRGTCSDATASHKDAPHLATHPDTKDTIGRIECVTKTIINNQLQGGHITLCTNRNVLGLGKETSKSGEINRLSFS